MKKEPFSFQKYKSKRLCSFNSSVAAPVASRQTEGLLKEWATEAPLKSIVMRVKESCVTKKE
ncbi:MAG: hypothetical protein DHS20C07_15900 [Methyloligella sp.]|nr:MAG: hypothetical protein DHS20C07_15900 [Methyloligella sp.]